MRTQGKCFSWYSLSWIVGALLPACQSEPTPLPGLQQPARDLGAADPGTEPAALAPAASPGEEDNAAHAPTPAATPAEGPTQVVENLAPAPTPDPAPPAGTSPPASTTPDPVAPAPPCAQACPLPAFPGADGAGGNVSGGRGGDVYHVTRLDTDFSDVTPGTLRFGLTNVTAPRTIVFDISGVFQLGRTAVAGWDDNGNGWDTASRLNLPSNVTIAGQTAPGPVILMGGGFKAGGANIILRNVTIAPGYGSRGFDEPTRLPALGDFPDSYVYDAIDISGHDLIIDHVTTVYATDETISMNELVTNATVQYSNISQGQNYPQADAEADGVRYTGHALGSLLQAGSNARISVHHNLYAHQKGRLPRVGTEADALTVAGVGAFNDFRNNVFYNWLDTAGTGASGQASQNNFIGNFYLAGSGGQNPSGGASLDLGTSAGGTSIFDGKDAINTLVFHAGNLRDSNLDGDALDGTPLSDADFIASNLQTAPFAEVPYVGVTDAADVALARVLDYAGSRYWERSPIDQRIIAEVRAGTGQILAWADDPFNPAADEGVEWRSLLATPAVSRPAGFDTDQDGMPDDWELEHALDPGVADNNGDFDADGYTNLEEYINELAAWPAATATLFIGRQNQRYAQSQNWAVGSALPSKQTNGSSGLGAWQPGPRDSAQILSGTVVVDAPGQQAGVLDIAAPSGLAKLELSSGSLDAESVFVGSHGAIQQGAIQQGAMQRGGASQRTPGMGQLQQSGGLLRARRALVIGAVGANATGNASASAAEYNLTGGTLSTARLLLGAPAGAFNFTGGTLHAELVGFDLENHGGVLWPGRLTTAEHTTAERATAEHTAVERPSSSASSGEAVFGELRVRGNLRLQSGSLRILLGAAASDCVNVDGDVTLGGTLDVQLLAGVQPQPGDSWTILTAQGEITGEFAAVPAGYRVRTLGPRVLLSYGAQRADRAIGSQRADRGQQASGATASLAEFGLGAAAR